MLALACWQPRKILWNGKQRELPAGSIIFGLKEFADKWDCSRATISKWCKYLEETKRISYETSTAGCLAIICNWEVYQSADDLPLTPTERGVNVALTTRERDVALNEELRIKESKNRIPASSLVAERKPLADQDLEDCYRAWLETLRHFKTPRTNILTDEQTLIVRAVQRAGSAKAVAFALRGLQHEAKSEEYNPANFVNLGRVLDPKHFNRFMNLGIQAEHRLRPEGQ